MPEKQGGHRPYPDKWDNNQVRIALASAQAQATRFSRQWRMSQVDREDLVQDILLAIVEANWRYDGARGAWSTFVRVVAQRAIVDRARQPPQPETHSLENSSVAAILHRISAPQPDPDIVIAFVQGEQELPPAPRALLRQIIAHRDVVAARDASATSPATFYRELHDLRCWLRALGACPVGADRKAAAARRAALP